MAKGNLGNLLQHFVGLRSMQVLAAAWNRPQEPILFVDCYSMGPWEQINKNGRSEGYDTLVLRFPKKAMQCDFVAKTFMTAWGQHYASSKIPDNPRKRNYPNSAVLLLAAFPNQKWLMRLHDIKVYKRTKLRAWARKQVLVQCQIAGKWSKSPLIDHAPVPCDKPVFVMLDPYQIVGDKNPDAKKNGFLTDSMISRLFGTEGLDLVNRPGLKGAAPAVITLFSYSNTQQQVIDASKIVTRYFKKRRWSVERVKVKKQRTGTNMTCHVGWVAHSGLPKLILGQQLQ